MFDALGTGPKPKSSRKPKIIASLNAKEVAFIPSKVEAKVDELIIKSVASVTAPIEEVVEEKIETVAYSFFEVGPKGFLDGSPDVLTPKDVLSVKKPNTNADLNIKIFTPEEAKSVTELANVELPSVAAEVILPIVCEDACYADLMRSLIAEFPTKQEGTLLFVTPPSVQIADAVLKLSKEAALWGEVILVEARENAGNLYRSLGLKEGPGWQDVVAGKADLEDCIQVTGTAGLKVLTAGVRQNGLKFAPRLIARSPRGLVRALRKQHRLILIDGGVWSEESGALGLARECDGICLLVPSSKSGSATVEEILGRIEDSGSRLAGVLVLPNQERTKIHKNAA